MIPSQSRRDILRGVGATAGTIGLFSTESLAAVSDYAVYATDVDTVYRVDTSDGSVIWSVSLTGESITDVTASPDDSEVAISTESILSGYGPSIYVYDALDGTEKRKETLSNRTVALEWAPNGYLWVSFGNGELRRYTQPGFSGETIKTYSNPVTSMDPYDGDCYVNTGEIFEKLDAFTGGAFWTITGRFGFGNATLYNPDDDCVYFVDSNYVADNRKGDKDDYHYPNLSAYTNGGNFLFENEMTSTKTSEPNALALDFNESGIYVGLGNGEIFGYDETTGESESNFPVTKSGPVTAMSNGMDNAGVWAGLDGSVTDNLITFHSFYGTTELQSNITPDTIENLVTAKAPPEPTATPTDTQTETATDTSSPGTEKVGKGFSAGPAMLWGGIFAMLLAVGVRYKNPLSVAFLALSGCALVLKLLYGLGGNLFMFGVVMTTIITVVGLLVRVNA